MREVECEVCGKIIRGKSKAKARNNLKNHWVSHGSYNRLSNRRNGVGESKAGEIREEAKEALRGNGRGHSSKWIAEEIDIDTTPKGVGSSLSYGDDFVRVGGVNGKQAGTWQLREDVAEWATDVLLDDLGLEREDLPEVEVEK